MMAAPPDKNELIARLSRVLLHEVRMGCLDRAVFGGLERFATAWAAEATPALRSTALSKLPHEAVETLRSYSTKDPSQREASVRALLRRVSDGSAERAGRNVGAAAQTIPHRSKGQPARAEPRSEGPESVRRSPRPRTRVAAPVSSSAAARASTPATAGLQGLHSSVRTLPGVGSSYATKLERLGCHTIYDLLYLIPRRHIDYSAMKLVKDLRVGEVQSVQATIWEINTSPSRSGVKLTSATVADETGTINVIWFNQPHLTKTLSSGRQVMLSGRVEQSLGRPFLKAPDWELVESGNLIHTGRMIPVYPLTEGLPERWMRALVKRVIDRWVGEVQDHLPAGVRHKWDLVDLANAIYQIHFPEHKESLQKAQQRLAFDELFIVQLGMQAKKREWQESQPGNAFDVDPVVLAAFFSSLPFQMTSAQKKVFEEILADLRSRRPMVRLLQGDVGSGKTVVATASMVVAWDNGFQSALLAPTEILAEQHYRTISALAHSLNCHRGTGADRASNEMRVGLLTGNTKKAEKDALRQAVARGEIDVLVGTHAVIQEDVAFARLGLAIVDEQHRFGVEQRSALCQKGYNPHLLVMTATPIPRTLALTLYGDLELSVIDELPPGRQPVKTHLIGPQHREQAYVFVRKQISEGRQAFVICPLVEESEKVEAKAATAEYERLSTLVFPDLKLGLLHGKMRAREKELAMTDFRDGRLDILVSTAVVEVGIDVPNATVMLIEGADRFGLAQIHQFRGRVGRGAEKSYCLLLAESPSPEAEERLQATTRIHNGFLLAEEDLRLRGPGEFLGTRQSGLPDLKVAKLTDLAIFEQARAAALDLLEEDQHLQRPENRLLSHKVAEFWRAGGHLS